MRFLSPIRHPDVRQVRNAWDRFVRGESDDPPEVRTYVARAWRRSRDAGCDAHMPRADVLSPTDTESLLREHHRLLATAQPFLQALSRAAGTDRHAAMLADQSGRLLQVIGDDATMADENFPRAGSLLSEPLAGANGVGTCVAERGYVELVGPEHYIEGFHAFTCQGVPLYGSSNEMTAVLSVSVRRMETADRMRDILFCASEAAECELLASWLANMAADVREPVLERLRQDMVQRITMARLQLELAARQIATGADATATIDFALQLSRKFSRQAALWRTFVTDEAPSQDVGPIEFSDMVEDLVELLETEARVALVQFKWGRVDRVKVLADPSHLVRELLSCFLSAMQSSPSGAVLEINAIASPLSAHLSIQDKSIRDGRSERAIESKTYPLFRTGSS